VKEFKSLVMVRHPPAVLWTTVRDRLPELVPMLDDIEAVDVEARREEPDGTVHIVNVWRARPQIPAVLTSVLRAEMLAWTDRAEWRADTGECHWQIEPHFHPEWIRCQGITRYEAAMGGRGARVTFEGTLDVSGVSLSVVPAFLSEVTSQAIELFVTSLIPKNLQKLIRAASALLDGDAEGPLQVTRD
jgi:hypothetical protein